MSDKENGVPVVRHLAVKFSMLLAAIIIVLSVSMILLLRLNVRSRLNGELVSAVNAICASLLQSDSPDAVQNVELPYYVVFAVYDAQSGDMIFTNDPFLPLLPLTRTTPRRYTERNYFTDGDLDILYYARLYSKNDAIALINDENYAMQSERVQQDGDYVQQINSGEYIVQSALNMDTDTAEQLVSDLPRILLFVMLPLLLVSYFAALLISKRTMKSVHDMTETARKISSTQLDMRLPVSNKGDEFDALAQTFNDLLSRLQKDFEREKQFTADVSHELKTPLAVMLGHANLLKRWGKDDRVQLEKSLDALINEVHSMEAIIRNLLQISHLENGIVRTNKTRVDVHMLFERLSSDTAAWASGVSFSQDVAVRYVFADEELLYEACTIVISNSVKFAGAHAHIALSCEQADQNDFCDLIISDDGPGIASSALQYIFDRFYRADEAHERSNGGSGLGLSIVKSIIHVLGGYVRAENNLPHGAKIILTLLKAPAETVGTRTAQALISD